MVTVLSPGLNPQAVHTNMINYAAEAVGTALLILFGDGVVATVLLSRSKGENSGWIVITVGWGIAVMVAVYAVGRLSGAHLNPALTVALASIGAFPWTDVPGYVVAQMVGAFIGATLVWLMYLPHWAVTQNADLKLAVFCTAPAIRKASANFLTEALASAVFVFAVLAIGANSQSLSKPGDIDLSVVFSSGLQPLLVGGLIVGIGLSLGGSTGYAINPARDLSPRIAHFVLPIPGKRDSDWSYAWIPVVAPLIGATIGAQLFKAVGF